ncbi:MAG: hypothetical protein WEC75_04165 [Dehalococcoidia bacterium]
MARRGLSSAASAQASRLKVLAVGDEKAFLKLVVELLGGSDRLAREAALEALAERPLAGARDGLRELFFELSADGIKRDQGAIQRTSIVRTLRALGGMRDADVGMLAVDAREIAFGEDIAWRLRADGLMLLAEASPDLFPYIAIEHLGDTDGPDGEPANTAFQLLAGLGHYAPIYQWLISGERQPRAAAQVFELLAGGPREVVGRYVASTIETALRKADETMLTLLSEAVVSLELEDSYSALEGVLSAKVSDELYGYLGVLLAGTNRAPLLAILERQLHGGRRPKLILEGLRMRTTPEQQAIIDRWEEDHD